MNRFFAGFALCVQTGTKRDSVTYFTSPYVKRFKAEISLVDTVRMEPASGHPRWGAHRYGEGRDVASHHGASPDDAAAAYLNSLQNNCTYPDPDIVADQHRVTIQSLIPHRNICSAVVVGHRVDRAVTGDHHVLSNVDATIAGNDRAGPDPASMAD